MLLHIYMTVGFEGDTFRFQQWTLTTPTRSGAAFFIYDTMAGQ